MLTRPCFGEFAGLRRRRLRGRTGRAPGETRCWRIARLLRFWPKRPAIAEWRCATLADAGLVSVPARDRNQGSGLSGRDHERVELAAGLAAGELCISRRRPQHRPASMLARYPPIARTLARIPPDQQWLGAVVELLLPALVVMRSQMHDWGYCRSARRSSRGALRRDLRGEPSRRAPTFLWGTSIVSARGSRGEQRDADCWGCAFCPPDGAPGLQRRCGGFARSRSATL